MDHKWRASDLGPARDEAESGLGSGPSEVLGLKTDAGGVTRNAQSRSARATRRIGLWAESDYPLCFMHRFRTIWLDNEPSRPYLSSMFGAE